MPEETNATKYGGEINVYISSSIKDNTTWHYCCLIQVCSKCMYVLCSANRTANSIKKLMVKVSIILNDGRSLLGHNSFSSVCKTFTASFGQIIPADLRCSNLVNVTITINVTSWNKTKYWNFFRHHVPSRYVDSHWYSLFLTSFL